MYRQIFIPTMQNNCISIPPEWYGKKVEVIAFPVSETEATTEKQESIETKRKEIDEIFDKYLIDLSNFKFDRDEANNYD